MSVDRQLPPLDTDADRIVWLAGVARKRIERLRKAGKG